MRDLRVCLRNIFDTIVVVVCGVGLFLPGIPPPAASHPRPLIRCLSSAASHPLPLIGGASLEKHRHIHPHPAHTHERCATALLLPGIPAAPPEAHTRTLICYTRNERYASALLLPGIPAVNVLRLVRIFKMVRVLRKAVSLRILINALVNAILPVSR